ncbi:GNAT family N-acetyltransferase [Wenzhouxiangella sp. XN24]|uniref:GNAT family N-acetyltransferase n=1 Tax=Wenzhouxiangella sp. XN24 TaxID=2713569 RepID=UPI0013EBEFAE|nr:GNAT family N-acetyltransferase [Wenzhouxiangella sp. XN24]NGX16870.1 GNAT family N-acetyltransferase [Wenzhouxiangella sp. XN24]
MLKFDRQVLASLDDQAGAWADLLARSDADPLFNSPEWLATWWDHFGVRFGGILQKWSLTTGERLVGLLLLTERTMRHRAGLRGRRYEFLGTGRGDDLTVFSERTDVIVDPAHEDMVISRFAGELAQDSCWDELVVSYTPRDGVTHRMFKKLEGLCGGYLREADEFDAWEVPLAQKPSIVTDMLGRGTRERIFGSRRRLEKVGQVSERILAAQDFDHAWRIFDDLHRLRWGRPLERHWQLFLDDIARIQARRGVPVMSVLEFEGEPISVMVNFRAADHEYALTSAFRPSPVKRVSPGWMHFGYVLERACHDGLAWFDLLGGKGKNEQYKAAMGRRRTELVCLQLLRRWHLKLPYKAWDTIGMPRHSLSNGTGG